MYPDQSRIYYPLIGRILKVMIPHLKHSTPLAHKRVVGDSNDRSIWRQLILRDESGEETSLEGSLEIPSSTGSPALSPSGFPNGSVILAPSDTLGLDSAKEAPSTAPVSPVRPVIQASEGEISLIDPLDSLAWECYPFTVRKMNYS